MKTLHPTYYETPTEHITVHVETATEALPRPADGSITERVLLAAPYIPGHDGAHQPAAADTYSEVTDEMTSPHAYGTVGRIAARSVLHEEDLPLPPLETEHKATNMPGKSKFASSLGFLLRGKRAATRNATSRAGQPPAPRYSDSPNAPTDVQLSHPDYDFSTDIELGAARTAEDDFATRADIMRREHGLELLTAEEVGMPADPLANVSDRSVYEYHQAQAAPGVDNKTYLLQQISPRGK